MTRWLGEDGRVRRPAAPSGAAPAAVEDRELDSSPPCKVGERALRAKDLPLCGQVAAVLPRIGVADHDLDARAPSLDQAGEARIVEDALHRLRRRPEGCDRLEERDDRQLEASLLGDVAGVEHVIRGRRPRHDQRVESLRSVSLTHTFHRCERLTYAVGADAKLVGMDSHVELREVKAEELDAATQCSKPAVRDPARPPRSKAAVEQVEIRRERRRRRVARLCVLERVAEPSPDEAELAPVWLVEVPVRELVRIARELPLVVVDRRGQLGRDRGELTGDPEHLGELANLADVRREREHARLLEGIGDRLWPGRRIAVQIASDPGAEPKGRRRSRHEPSVVGEQELGHPQQALLEEPQPMADLVDDARSVRAHFVRLPEERDLLRECRLDPPPARGRESCVVELGEKPAQPQVSGEHAAPSRLGRVRGEHELERQLSSCLLERLRLDARPLEAAERLGQ